MKTIFTCLLFIIVAINVNASIIYVNHAATGANNGTSWANAYTDLEYAMIFAMSGDEIWVAKGTYYTSSTNDRSSSFALGNGVKLYGNFAGTETNINQRVGLIPDAAGTDRVNETILNGDIGVANDSTDNAYHIMYIVGNTLPVIIDGVKITGGNASVDPGKGIGSGIYIQSTNDVFLKNVIIANNTATAGANGKGGGLYVQTTTSFILEYSTVIRNRIIDDPLVSTSAAYLGGGIYVSSPANQISNCFIENNKIQSGRSNSEGGGLYVVNNLNLNITNTSIINNSVISTTSTTAKYLKGGGIAGYGVTASVAELVSNNISNNAITSSRGYAYGSGSYFETDTLKVSDCIINANTINNSYKPTSYSNQGGGMYAYINKNASITNSFFNQNVISGRLAHGGGLFLASATDTVNIQSCEFSNNTLYSPNCYDGSVIGGGIYLGTKTKLNGCQINNNSVTIISTATSAYASGGAGAYGGGLAAFDYAELNNCSIDSNTLHANMTYNVDNYMTFPTISSRASGGGIYSSSKLILQNSSIDNNETMSSIDSYYYWSSYFKGYCFGGGVCNDYTTSGQKSLISNCTINNNTSNSYSGYAYSEMKGGGIYSRNMDILNCEISNNDTYVDLSVAGGLNQGGGIYHEGTGKLYHNTISYNDASAGTGYISGGYTSYTYGGGLYSKSADPVSNCLIHNNSVTGRNKAYGGGIYNESSSVFSNLTIAENTSYSSYTTPDNKGSGVYTNNSSAKFRNSIIYFNDLLSYYDQTTSSEVKNSVIQLYPNGATNFNIDPQFTDVAANDFHVSASSIAINRGDDSFIPSDITTDLDGNLRISGSSVDIGAYELDLCKSYTTIYDEICFGTPYIFNGQNLTASGIYKDTLTNVALCDSIITLNFTVNNPAYSTDVISACETYTWIDGLTYTTDNNTATFTYPGATADGCDSIVTLNLTINHATTGTDFITACGSYTWIDGITYTASNNTATFNIAGGAANGCDSLVTLNLTINNSATGTDVITACDSYTWIDGITYTASNNTATFNIIGGAANGCDSLVTLDLTINHSTTGTDVITACDSYTWIDGVTYTASNNTATFNIAGGAANGCDSLVTLNLTINNSAAGTDVISACDSYTWINGITYTASNNTATFNIIGGAANGCDSLVTLNLTINHSATGTDVITACDSYTWINGITYTASNNTATFNIAGGAANGCDSLVTLNLTINNSATGTDVISACDSYTWIDGVTYTESNNTATYYIAGGAANGCDSLVTLNLTINHSTTGTDVITACDSYTWIDGITYTASNNTATFNIAGGAANGCDSLVTLNLTINNSAAGTDVISACDSYTWINGITYTASNNTATFNIIGGAANGCDSLVTLDLTINHSTTGTDVITACDSYTWIDGITYTESNNTATFNIIGGAANGCDSLVSLNLTINHSATGTDVITACDSYTWIDGITYTASNNTATFNIAGGAANGCDSLVTLNLTINNSAAGTDVISACDSYTWINSITYTASNNTATFNIIGGAANGCDSLVTLDLTINHSTTGTDVITACDSYTWIDGITYTANNNTATFNIIGGAANGCDSLVTLNLTINNSATGTDVITACDSYTWIDGITYTESNNTATFNIAGGAANGCDSLVTLDLTINHSTTGTDVISACDSYTWIDGVTYTASNNTATFNIAGGAANGCDSLVTLDLTINHSTTGTDVITACDSYTWIDGITYTESNNTATFNIAGGAANGCDSLVTLDLTINNSTTGTDVITACDSYTWIDGITYTASNNTATFNITGGAANGCDSLVTLDLTINHSTTGTDVITACDSYTWIDGITYTASNNTATFNIAGGAANSCDSLVTLNLTINNSATGTDVITACDSYTWIDGVTYTASNNTATFNIAGGAANGCDSLVTLNLTINHSTTGTDVISACDSYTWIDGITYTESNNTATFNIAGGAANGCDSLVTLNLTINNSATGTDVITACDSYTWIDGVTYTESNNTATFNIIGGATNGCDSLVTLNLTINHSATGTDVITACDSYTWIDGVTYTESNNTATFNIIGGATNGCDSLVTLNLTINHSATGTDVISACDSYTWIDGITYTASNNTATFNIAGGAANGCDSLVTLNLTIAILDLSVSIDESKITSNTNGATYQWIDCSTNLPIENETYQSFIATVNGDYAVIVSLGTCSDTSACENIIVENIEPVSEIQFNIYPNPNNGQFKLDLNSDATIEISDALGRIIYSKQHQSGTSVINLENEEASVYYLRVISDGKISVQKVVVHK